MTRRHRDPTVALQAAIARAAAGLDVDASSLPSRVRDVLAVAGRLGAPRAPALEAAAAAARDRADLAQAVDVAAAEARSVARGLVLAPPVVGPLTAVLVSDTPFAVWGTTPGRILLAVAAALWLLGALVVRTLVRAAAAPVPAPGPDDHTLDLLAVALSAGIGLAASLRLVAGAAADARLAAVALWLELGARGPAPGGWEEVADVLAGARRDGVPLAGLARSLATARRRRDHHAAMQRAARLGARLSVPTTLLLLPAAGLVVAAPVLHGAIAVLG